MRGSNEIRVIESNNTIRRTLKAMTRGNDKRRAESNEEKK